MHEDAFDPLPSAGWWTAGEVLGWIAFRCRLHVLRYQELPERRPRRDWRNPSQELLEALEARARSEVWRPTGRLFFPAWRYRAFVRRLMRETGEAAAPLAADLRHDLEISARIDGSKAALRDALAQGRLTAFGYPSHDFGAPAAEQLLQSIPAEAFAGKLAMTIEPDGWTHPPRASQWHRGRRWQGAAFKEMEVLKVWPADDVAAPEPRETAAATWMRRYVHGTITNGGQKPKRDPTISLCQSTTGSTYREALAEWNALPPEWKNSPRKTKN